MYSSSFSGPWVTICQMRSFVLLILSMFVTMTNSLHVRFEVFTVVTMNNDVFWDVMPCDCCKNRCFRGTYHLHHKDDTNL
jgi:hypothetical protein